MGFIGSLAYPELSGYYDRLFNLLGPDQSGTLRLVDPSEYRALYAKVAAGIKVVLQAFDSDPAEGIDQLPLINQRIDARNEVVTTVVGEGIYTKARCRSSLSMNRLRSAVFGSLCAFWEGSGSNGCQRFNAELAPRAAKWLVESYAQSMGSPRVTQFDGIHNEEHIASVSPYTLSMALELIATGEIKNPW